MATDDRLTERPAAPPTDDRLTELPMALTSPLGGAFLSPVTIRVVAFVLFVYAFWPFAMIELLLAVGFGPRLSGAPTPEQSLPLMRLQLIADGLAFPLQAASVLVVLPRLAGIRLDQIGLTPRRLGRNCLWGFVGWLALTPACFAVNYAVIALYGSQAAANVQEHPFVQLAARGLTPLEWFLLIFTATIAAPAMEEVLFRGALQSWLERRVWAPALAMGLALVVAVLMKGNDIRAAWPQGGGELLLHLTPVLFILGLIGLYPAVHAFGRGTAAPAVFAASALFASVHSFAWPSPVALLLLALGLGWMAHRTRSLAGPIVLHGLFNAVSCVLLFFPQSAVTP